MIKKGDWIKQNGWKDYFEVDKVEDGTIWIKSSSGNVYPYPLPLTIPGTVWEIKERTLKEYLEINEIGLVAGEKQKEEDIMDITRRMF